MSKQIITEKMFSMLEKQAIEIIGETNEFYIPILKGDMMAYHDIELEIKNGYLIEKVEKEFFMGKDSMGYEKFSRETVCFLEKRIDFEFEEKARLLGFTDY